MTTLDEVRRRAISAFRNDPKEAEAADRCDECHKRGTREAWSRREFLMKDGRVVCERHAHAIGLVFIAKDLRGQD